MAAPISKRCSCTSPAPAPPWSPRSDAPRHPPRRRAVLLAGPHLGDAAALPVYPSQLLAAHPGAALLADPPDADLGLHEPVPLPEQQLCRARLWRAAGGGDAVGPAVSQSARPVDLVSRGDVGPQSRAAVRDPAAAL